VCSSDLTPKDFQLNRIMMDIVAFASPDAAPPSPVAAQ
jgi:hypothetical protein